MQINKLTIEIEPIEDKRFELTIKVAIEGKGLQTYMATVPTDDGRIFGYELKVAIEKGLKDIGAWEGEK